MHRVIFTHEYIKKRIDTLWAIAFGLWGGYTKMFSMFLDSTLIDRFIIPGIQAGFCAAMGVLGKKLVEWAIIGFKAKRTKRKAKLKNNTDR